MTKTYCKGCEIPEPHGYGHHTCGDVSGGKRPAKNCPTCQGPTIRISRPCPQRIDGCAVNHTRVGCRNCEHDSPPRFKDGDPAWCTYRDTDETRLDGAVTVVGFASFNDDPLSYKVRDASGRVHYVGPNELRDLPTNDEK